MNCIVIFGIIRLQKHFSRPLRSMLKYSTMLHVFDAQQNHAADLGINGDLGLFPNALSFVK